uniref:PROP1-like PPR domain-containing protein n=1 Tax=Kalanchoe fedtschenkoi TaxID=63787 RepID=A0A7N0ZVU5_KALFE
MSLENLKSRLLKEALRASSSSSQQWRKQAKQNQLVTQISSILLQRRNWVSLLRALLNLTSSNLTPPLFNQILRRTQSNPELSLSFFHWVRSDLNLRPDVRAHCKLVLVAVQSDLDHQARQILTSLRELESDPARVVGCLIGACGGRDCEDKVLSFVVGWYALEGLSAEALRAFREIRVYGCLPDVRACSALLGALVREEEMKPAWGVYGALVRHGVAPDKLTWVAIGQILGKDGSFGRLERLLNLGVCNSVMFNLVVNGLCEKSELRAAFKVFDEMSDKGIQPGFSSYASVLDGACKCKDEEMVDPVMAAMVKKRLLSGSLSKSFEYDEVIQKLADLGKSYAAEMLFQRARGGEFKLQGATYGCLLRAMSNEGRVEEAIHVYKKAVVEGVKVKDSAYYAFANALCKCNPTEELSGLLRCLIERGIHPKASELSCFIKLLCGKGRWREAEELLDLIMDEKSLPYLDCCSYLVKHYCRTKQVEAAIALHDRVEKLNGNLDSSSYNTLLDVLSPAGRGDDAEKVFEYMRMKNLLTCDGFAVMIRWLCSRKEMRKAMKYHDEMLKMGLKPDQRRYKQLISGFQ